jgi:type II secretory pathway pseudopilin PulG
MSHPIGTALFLLAVLVNFVLIAGGLVWSLALSTYRGVRSSQARNATALQLQSGYHHADAIRTPGFEKLFMAAAIALVMVGLPVALAAIFHYVLPLLGNAWAP